MENEMYGFVQVWLVVFLCLCYCHVVVANITNLGFTRLFCVLPVVCLFLVLPLNLSSVHLVPITAFSVAWLANFKLLLFAFEIIQAVSAGLGRAVLGVELERQFKEPYLATSVQDFWGRRWNLTVTKIMRPAVYDPVYSLSSRTVGRKWAAFPAVMATFVASGVMHELVFYYMVRVRPTWEFTWFFVLHGTCLAAEIGVKKVVAGKFRLPAVVGWMVSFGLLTVSGVWLLTQVVRGDVFVRVLEENAAVGAWVSDFIGGMVGKVC